MFVSELLLNYTSTSVSLFMSLFFETQFLSQVLEKVEVWESIKREGKGHRHRLYKVKLSFLPESYYAVSTCRITYIYK